MNAKTSADAGEPGAGRVPLPTSLSSYSPDSTTAGTESRNENRAAASRVSPRNSPAVIVVPDRDAPGISASACAVPTTTASMVVSSSSPRVRVPTVSAANSTRASAIRVEAMTQRLRAPVLIWWLKISPNRPTGMVARIRYQPILYSSVLRTDLSTEPAEPGDGDVQQLAPEVDDDREHRAELDDRGEAPASRVVPARTAPGRCAGARSRTPAGTRSAPARCPGRWTGTGSSRSHVPDLSQGLRPTPRQASRRRSLEASSPYGRDRQRGDPGLGELGHPVGDPLDRARAATSRRRTRTGRRRRPRRSRGPGRGPAPAPAASPKPMRVARAL